jgi:hypothetical protein
MKIKDKQTTIGFIQLEKKIIEFGIKPFFLNENALLLSTRP